MLGVNYTFKCNTLRDFLGTNLAVFGNAKLSFARKRREICPKTRVYNFLPETNPSI